MDAVTYPHAAVAEEIAQYFVPARFNTLDPGATERALMREFRQAWTPTFVFLDPHRIELRRNVGFLPPTEFLPELRFVRAYADLFRGEAGRAFELFVSLADAHPQAAVAPEALYWAGIAGYRRDGGRDELIRQWTVLHERYPESLWWVRASFVAS